VWAGSSAAAVAIAAAASFCCSPLELQGFASNLGIDILSLQVLNGWYFNSCLELNSTNALVCKSPELQSACHADNSYVFLCQRFVLTAWVLCQGKDAQSGRGVHRSTLKSLPVSDRQAR
jgi:hypothetical protein